VAGKIATLSSSASNADISVQSVAKSANRVFIEAETMQTDVEGFVGNIERMLKDLDREEAPTLVWQDRLSVGNEVMDGDHHRLFNLFNQLSAAQTSNADAATLEKCLAELVAYTGYHFEREEELMRKAGYPDLESHIREHQAFVRKATEAVQAFNQSKSTTIILDVLKLVRGWLVNHIQKEDQRYTPHVQKLSA
jgi:hemerythrin-like metal-binding protein